LLTDNGFTRLAGYWVYFQAEPGRSDKTLAAGVTVRDVAGVYVFDSRLRHLLGVGLELFEVALRARLGQAMSMAGLAYSYRDPAKYRDPRGGASGPVAGLMGVMEADLGRSRERFIREPLSDGVNPPLWAAMEAFSLGTVSKMYRLLAERDVRRAVAKSFGYPHAMFAERTFHSLTVLRNHVAHHARIWQRGNIQYAPPVLHRLQTDPDKRIYQRTPWAWLSVVADLADAIGGDSSYSRGLWDYIAAHPAYAEGLKRPRAA
jgi:abortive infection bacteriophage resistance protein